VNKLYQYYSLDECSTTDTIEQLVDIQRHYSLEQAFLVEYTSLFMTSLFDMWQLLDYNNFFASMRLVKFTQSVKIYVNHIRI
jgi:hypothetical protein